MDYFIDKAFTFNRSWFSVHAQRNDVANIYFGPDEALKTEADAREAAELLKALFEAKDAGKDARLVVDEKQCLGERCVLDGECFSRDKGLCWFDPANKWPPVPEDTQRFKNTVIDQMNAYRERREAFKVAKLAALIFAHNAHDFDERRSVQAAAKILDYAKQKSE